MIRETAKSHAWTHVPDSGRRGCRSEGHEHGPTQCRSYDLLLLFSTRPASVSSFQQAGAVHMDGHYHSARTRELGKPAPLLC